MLIFFLKWDPNFFCIFGGPRHGEHGATVEKSKKSILFDADAIFKAVTAHAKVLKKICLLKCLMMSYHTRSHLTTLLQ